MLTCVFYLDEDFNGESNLHGVLTREEEEDILWRSN